MSAKAEGIKSSIFKYCDQRCKKSGEFHGADLATPEVKGYIEKLLYFIFGRLEFECWGFDDLLGAKCKKADRKALFEGKYKSRKGAVQACQKMINVKIIMGMFNDVWSKCVAGSDGKG